MREILEALESAIERGGDPVVATVVEAQGSVYRKEGAKTLIHESGEMVGTISGGCLDRDLVERAREVRADRHCRLARYDTRAMNDEIFGLGLGCGGEVEIWLEPIDWWKTSAGRYSLTTIRQAFEAGESTVLSTVLRRDGRPVVDIDRRIGAPDQKVPRSRRQMVDSRDVFLDCLDPPRSMILLGAGVDAQPIARIATEAGFEVTVICEGDADRDRRRFPGATVIARRGGNIANVPLRGKPAVVLATHRTATDREALRSLLPRIAELSYLGILGPRSRTQSLVAELSAEGISIAPELLGRLYGPAGLDLGSDAPGEIALSIIAEALAAANGCSARPLREKSPGGSPKTSPV